MPIEITFNNLEDALSEMRQGKEGFDCMEIGRWVSSIDKDEEHIVSYSYENTSQYLRYSILKYHSTQTFVLISDGYYKSDMIRCAELDDLEGFVESFKSTEKMISYALETAIMKKSMKVVKYLADNYPNYGGHIWNAIRYKNHEGLNYFLEKNFPIPSDWLAYCLYNNNLEGLKIMIQYTKLDKTEFDELQKTQWLRKEMYNTSSECVIYLKEYFK
jgi:hypothetical protein